MMRSIILACGAVLLGVSTAQAAPVVVLSNDFTNATRVGTSPTVAGVDADGGTTNDWVAASDNIAMAVGTASADLATNVGSGINGNSLFVRNAGAFYSLSTTFATQTFSAVGDKISLSLNIRTAIASPGTGNGSFRVGLFDHGGTVLAANTIGSAGGGAFADDSGYIAYYSTAAGSISSTGYEKTGGTPTTNLFAANTSLLLAGSSGSAVLFDTTYPVTLDLERTASGVRLTSSFNGAVIDVTDTSTLRTNFNELGVFFGSPWGTSSNSRPNYVDDVVVTYTAVPEPAAMGLLGLVTLSLLRRRH